MPMSTLMRHPSHDEFRRLDSSLGALNQVVDAKQDEGSDEGHEETGGLIGFVVADERGQARFREKNRRCR